MQFKNVVLEAYAYENPTQFLSSEEIEHELSHLYERLKISTGRFEFMTGIKSRGLFPIGTPPSSIATAAGKKALINIDPKSIDLLIHSGVCRDFLEPATASVVHQNLGLSPHAQIMDVSNACLGFLNSIVIAGSMIESGLIKRALIVTGENAGPLLKATLHKLKTDPEINRKNLKKYFANLTIGSAGIAMVISHKDLAPHAPEFLGGSAMTDSSANHLCRGDGNTHELMMETDSEELMYQGIKLCKNNFAKLKSLCEIGDEKISMVLTHQVGSTHERLSLENIQMQNKKSFRTYTEYGNTGSAALPLTLIKSIEAKQVQNDDLIALLGIGSGLSSIMLFLKWKQI